MADLEERMKTLVGDSPEEEDGAGDTFAERADSYYRKRPQLLSLLQDLHGAYVSLADRYSQTLAKHHRHLNHHRRSSSQLSAVALDRDGGDYSGMESDAESALSYQALISPPGQEIDLDAVIAELVMKSVEYDLAVERIAEAERRYGESGRKIDLQRSLLEVLEAERLVLLNENARLGYRAEALAEENEMMTAEAAALKRKAGELARCVLRMRENHRVCLLGRKIEDLQAQVRGLEKRNGEYCEMLLRRSDLKDCTKRKKTSGCGGGGGDAVVLDLLCFPAEKSKLIKRSPAGEAQGGGGRKAGKWWERLRRSLDVFRCVAHTQFP